MKSGSEGKEGRITSGEGSGLVNSVREEKKGERSEENTGSEEDKSSGSEERSA